MNSLVANYLVRLQVTTHVTCALMARLPVPRPQRNSVEFRELAALARALGRTGVAGHEAPYARVNAIAAHLYGLTRSQVRTRSLDVPVAAQDVDLAVLDCLRTGRRHAEVNTEGLLCGQLWVAGSLWLVSDAGP